MTGNDAVEKIVLIDNTTVIRRFHDTLTAQDLQVDNGVLIIGTPNAEGKIEAKLIRVMPKPIAPAPQASITP